MNKLTLILPFVLVSQVALAEVAPILQPVCYAGATALDQAGRFESQVLQSEDGDFKVVNDIATGLQWTYCPYGQVTTAEGSCSGLQKTIPGGWSANNPLEINKIVNQENTRLGEYVHPWRTANFNESMSIFNKDCSPNIYTNFYYPQLSQVTLDEILALKLADSHQATMQWVLSGLFTYATETQGKNVKRVHSINYGYSSDVLRQLGAGGNIRLVREIPSE